MFKTNQFSSNDPVVSGFLPEVHSYGFQGQEEDNELWAGGVSFKYRVEDARLGRFFSVDPLFSQYSYNSPYAFSENRLVDSIELEGLEKKKVAPDDGSESAMDMTAGYAKTDEDIAKWLKTPIKLEPTDEQTAAKAAFKLENETVSPEVVVGSTNLIKSKGSSKKAGGNDDSFLKKEAEKAANGLVEDATALGAEIKYDGEDFDQELSISLGRFSSETSGFSLGLASQEKEMKTREVFITKERTVGDITLNLPTQYTVTQTYESTSILCFVIETKNVYVQQFQTKPKLVFSNDRYGISLGKDLFKLGPVEVGFGLTFYTDW